MNEIVSFALIVSERSKTMVSRSHYSQTDFRTPLELETKKFKQGQFSDLIL